MWPFFNNKYPYTDFHELNTDWIISKIHQLEHTVISFSDKIKESVYSWLDEHPEATTTVQDDSITFDKLNPNLKGDQIPYTSPFVSEDGSGLDWYKPFVTPEMFGAVGDNTTDDTAAWQKALDQGITVICRSDAVYLINQPLRVKANTTILLNGCTVKAGYLHLFFNFEDSDVFTLYNGNGNITIRDGVIDGGSISFIHGKNILFSNIDFRNCLNDHYIEICACNNFRVENCTFTGMTTTALSQKEYINIDNCIYSSFPHFTDAASLTYDGTVVDGVYIDNCVFNRNGTDMADAVGKHSYYNDGDQTERRAKNIYIRNCRIIGATECAVMLRSVENALIDSCIMDSCDKVMEARYSVNVSVTNNTARTVNSYCRTQALTRFKFNDNYVQMAANSYIINFSGVNDDIEFCGNTTINNLGNSSPLRFYLLTSISDFKIMNNINKTQDRRKMFDTPTSGTFQISFCDNILFWDGNGDTATNRYLDLTDFNTMIIQSGAIGTDNYTQSIVKSFFGRNFVVGETYPVIHSDGSDIILDTVTITDEHTLTFTDQYIRGVTVQALPTM